MTTSDLMRGVVEGNAREQVRGYTRQRKKGGITRAIDITQVSPIGALRSYESCGRINLKKKIRIDKTLFEYL